MLRYERDEYVEEHPSDDDVNVDTVASWRVRSAAAAQVASLVVDLHNGWRFDLDEWHGDAEVPERLLNTLMRGQQGRLWRQPQ